MTRGRANNIRWLSWGADPGITDPLNENERKSFARFIWGGPWYRPVSLGLANPWSGWRLFTIRLPWFAFPFISLRFGKLLFYFGAKTYTLCEGESCRGHTYPHRPGDEGKLVATFSARIGWEPIS